MENKEITQEQKEAIQKDAIRLRAVRDEVHKQIQRQSPMDELQIDAQETAAFFNALADSTTWNQPRMFFVINQIKETITQTQEGQIIPSLKKEMISSIDEILQHLSELSYYRELINRKLDESGIYLNQVDSVADSL